MESVSLVLKSLQMGLPVLVGHLSVALLLWLASIAITCLATPCHEFRGMREGGVASALTTGGGALALSIPIGVCLAGAVNAWDIVLWSVPVILFQLLSYWLAHFMVPNLTARLDAEDMAAAVFLFLFRLGFACINAAAIAV